MKFALIFLILSTALIAGCSDVSMTFRSEGCSNELDIQDLPKDGITNQTWINQTLAVDGYVKTVCGGVDILKGIYIIEGGNITLKYRIATIKLIPSCICKHNIHYAFSGLEKKDYSIKIEQQP